MRHKKDDPNCQCANCWSDFVEKAKVRLKAKFEGTAIPPCEYWYSCLDRHTLSTSNSDREAKLRCGTCRHWHNSEVKYYFEVKPTAKP